MGIFIFLFPIIVSLISPEIAAYYIIILNVYFLYKSVAYAFQFALALVRIRSAEQINWQARLLGLRDIPNEIVQLHNEKALIKQFKYDEFIKGTTQAKTEIKNRLLKIKVPSIFKKFIFNIEKGKTISFLNNEIKKLEELKNVVTASPDEIRHIIIIPHVKEPLEILRETVQKIKDQTFNTKQIVVVLAAEAADANGVKTSELLKEEFKDVFFDIWITNHVLGPDEIVGKSSNMAWAGKQAALKIKELGWDFEKTMVTSCDADSKFPKEYFSYVTYSFLTNPDGKYKFFNAAMVLYNNIWRLPFYARVKNSMSTIYNVGRLVRTDKLVPFSTYTISFWMVDQIGYWTPWITPEDFHLFFKSLFKLKDRVSTVPIYLKIMSDSAEGEGHWETIKNNYKQERRWSWGISDDGWILKNVLQKWGEYSLKVKYMAAHVIFDHVMGPVGSLIILVGGNLPPLLNPSFANQVIGVKLPGISSSVIQITIIFMVIVVFLDLFLKPSPTNKSIFTRITSLFEWLIQPIAGIFLSMIPGLEAHTRLLFGKYLEYYVTKKKGA